VDKGFSGLLSEISEQPATPAARRPSPRRASARGSLAHRAAEGFDAKRNSP